MSDEMQQSAEVAKPAVAPQAAAPQSAPAGHSFQAPAGTNPRGPRAGGGQGGFGNRGGAGGGARGGRSQGGNRGGSGGRGGRPGGGNRGGGRGGDVPAEADYEEKNLEIARVTRVTQGGKRMRFRALSVIGNRKGRVGFGLAKGLDVAAATSKAVTQARKALVNVPLVNETIPHAVSAKFGAARVLLMPAPKGTSVKAGGAIRTVLEFAGIPNVVSKMLGSSNKINNVKATFLALKKLRLPPKAEKAITETPKA